VIGGVLFLAGLTFQAALTSGLHVPSILSYVAQAVLSVEASFLLNRWLTWRKRATAFWPSFGRYNLQKTITVAANLLLYAGLLRLGMNYLIANVLLTAVFTIVNYIGGDRFVFTPGNVDAEPLAAASVDSYQDGPRSMASAGRLSMAGAVGYQDFPELTETTMPLPGIRHQHTPELTESAQPLPTVSVVIPCRDNYKTIRAAVVSLLHQDYPELREIILIGSPIDNTWEGLEGIRDWRLIVQEVEAPPGIRDANFKRDVGIRESSSKLVALVDSDMVLPHDWLSRAVAALSDSGADCVAGVMQSVSDDFWGRFADRCRLGAKTPRVDDPYFVTAENFGAGGRKPPITANILFTREVYDRCPINSLWSHGSLEDYEWFWRIVEGGNRVLVTQQLFGWHHHRAGLKRLAAEYRRSARGCAYFIRAHRNSPFARKRLAQAVTLPLVPAAVLAGLTTAAITGYALQAVALAAAVALLSTVFLCGREFVRTRTLESIAYPLPAIILGASYTASLITHLVRRAPMTTVAIPTSEASSAQPSQAPRARRSVLSGLLHPLTAILALQAGLSLTMVWSNTAFSDEALYLWAGRIVIGNWLHGTNASTITVFKGYFSGSPDIYPPIGAIANSIGGLAGARILSLIFMLAATTLLYLVTKELFNARAAYIGAAIWAVGDSVLRLAFATYDPMSVLLVALSGWLILQAGRRNRRGEIVAGAAGTLALSNVVAYSGIVIAPVVIAFAFLVWQSGMGARKATYAAGWLAGVWAICFVGFMTITRSWPGIKYTIFARQVVTKTAAMHIVGDAWSLAGIIICLSLLGAAIGFSGGRRDRSLLLLLAIAGLVILIAQIHDNSGVSLDKHLAYGTWFAAMAAGYGVAAIIKVPSVASRQLVTISCVIALIVPAVSGMVAAWHTYHSWANASSFLSAFAPIAAREPGYEYVSTGASGVNTVAEYYEKYAPGKLGQGSMPVTTLLTQSYYSAQLHRGGYGVIAIFYTITLSAPPLSGSVLLSPASQTQRALLKLVAANSNANGQEVGLPALTLAVESDPAYRLVATGPYNSDDQDRVYAIWEKIKR
jgi:putative flippase GtrA/glycosyltransferase involved in cell wall biosynthesis